MIDNSELKSIKGGVSKWIYYGFGVGAIVSFITGLIDGYLRPLACNK